MTAIDVFLGMLAAGQVVLSTMRTGCRFLETRTASEYRLSGPLILPPCGNESSTIWEVANVFREAVWLGLLGNNYTSIKAEFSIPGATFSAVPPNPYSISLRPVSSQQSRQIEKSQPGAQTECLMEGNETEKSDGNVTECEDSPPVPGHPVISDSNRPVSVRAYAVDQFAELRSMFGITETTFRRSILESGPFVSFQSNSKGAARIGGIFFFSPDGAFLVKTIKKEEVATLMRILPKYCEYMKENGRQTLLTRFCGMYDVCINDRNLTLVIMNSVFPARSSRKLVERFDLKGSLVGRECSEGDRLQGRNAVLKDLDLVRGTEIETGGWARGNRSDQFCIGSSAKAAMFAQLERDVGLLVNCSVIDYSLLVGVEPKPSPEPKGRIPLTPVRTFLSTKIRGPTFVDGGALASMMGARRGYPVVFYFGIIDFLQPFDIKKTAEWRLKSLVHEKNSFSCVPPDVYAQRLLEFLHKHIT